MFSYLLMMGMTVGVCVYALTFLFVRQGYQKRRVGVMFLTGLLLLLSSIVFIGGFEGMPYGIIGLGTLGSSVLFIFTVSFPKWTKWISFLILILFSIWTVYLLSQYYMEKNVDYWIVNQQHLAKKDDSYSQQVRSLILETEQENRKGYRLVQLENGKGILLSIGKTIKVKEVVTQKNQMTIIIDIVSNTTNKSHSTTLIGVPFYADHLLIKDTKNKTYPEILE